MANGPTPRRRIPNRPGEPVAGAPQDEATTLAPMARQDLRDELHKQVQASIAKGATALLGGAPETGTHAGYPATILDQVVPGMPAYDEELFGPVAAILRVADEAEAVRVANDTSFGLAGSIWTRDIGRALRVAKAVRAGSLAINSNQVIHTKAPFGGYKMSGMGRENGMHAFESYTQVKNVYVDLS